LKSQQIIGRGSRPRRAYLFAPLGGLFLAAALVLAVAASDQPSDDHIGVIDGDNIAINGPMTIDSVGGQIKTVLRSGSDVRVKSGQAKISLLEGGQISLCGAAHLSLLKSGGTLTLALDSGVIHVRVDHEPALIIYTPQIQGKPIAVGDAPRDLLVGFESAGVMCIRTFRGALRLEQQLSGESVIVPQGADVSLSNGQLDSLKDGQAHCQCELQIAKSAPSFPPSSHTPNLATSPPSSSEAGSESSDEAQVVSPSSDGTTTAPEKPAPNDDRIYQVAMPPLVYDATAKVQPEPDPRIMIIVRRVRVRPTVIFQGRVDAEPEKPAAVASLAPPAPTVTPPVVPAKKPEAPPSFTDRVRSFFRSMWTHSP